MHMNISKLQVLLKAALKLASILLWLSFEFTLATLQTTGEARRMNHYDTQFRNNLIRPVAFIDLQ